MQPSCLVGNNKDAQDKDAQSQSPSSDSSIGAPSALLPLRSDPWEWLLARPDISTCVERLSVDDKDVFVHMQLLGSLPEFKHIAFASKSCRGHKTPPGPLNLP